MDYTGKSDPFICVMVIEPGKKARQIYQSEVIEQTLTPTWNESVRIKNTFLQDEGVVFRFDLYDKDAFSNDYMGHFEIPVTEMKKSFDKWFPLLPKKGKKASTVSGALKIKCVAQGDAVDTREMVAQASLKIKAGEYVAATALLKEASEHGNHTAKRDLALLLKEGKGEEKDPMEARRLLTQASKNGDAVAENCLGYMKHYGIGGTKNLIEAKEHYEIAANADLAAGKYNLGYAYFTGAGVQQDYEKARQYFGDAAEVCYPPALNNLGFCYQFGLGGDKDVKEAVSCYEKAVFRDYAPAMVNLGQYKQFVVGGKEGEQEAKKLYEQALELENDNPQAWFCLGLCLELGVGGEEPDLDKAKKAYEAANKYGESEGEKALKRLRRGGAKKRERSLSSRGGDKKNQKNRPSKKLTLSTSSAQGKRGHRRTRSVGTSEDKDKEKEKEKEKLKAPASPQMRGRGK
eukprot:CAMPEP_0201524248 /NCGR_PEP_ID=MMETSP0161_2-20130828/21195_1 /ASSEMBLY_ACC=CAM_ASM_000251 /TAXON_ID=180227 /ORGANISM="Neoparamoeba aestuarina, Strain SoJaBio B1-5/56/2" /LENGTH=459 /DNA_ID=CAMNT_0047923547 /DNA_START=250 /DNA_END=1629 /DNA_ORIENTATION=-